MRESNGFYVCDFVVTGLPLDAPVSIEVVLADHRSLPFETWKGGSQAHPPPGQQRVIQNGIQKATLSEAQPRATMVFEMVYAPPPWRSPNQRATKEAARDAALNLQARPDARRKNDRRAF